MRYLKVLESMIQFADTVKISLQSFDGLMLTPRLITVECSSKGLYQTRVKIGLQRMPCIASFLWAFFFMENVLQGRIINFLQRQFFRGENLP